MEAKQNLEDCIAAQDFSRAAEVKDSIAELETRRTQILHEVVEIDQPAEREVGVEKNDSDTLLRCLTMCLELLRELNIKTRICPTISGLMSSLILPSIANANPAVRNMAVLCLGTCTLHCRKLAKTHMVLLLQIAQLDEVKIRISALRSIVDQLLIFGFQHLNEGPPAQQVRSPDQNAEGAKDQSDIPEDTAQSVLVMLSDLMDSEVTDLRTEAAQGLAKLMYLGRLTSAKMFSRLVLMWYNPVTEDDIHLRNCLGIFFQLYARESRANQIVVEESFLLTIRTLLDAPPTSPLAEVDMGNVIELLVELTRPSLVPKPFADTEICTHDDLALRVCGQILSDPAAPETRLFARTLSFLELSEDETFRKDLKTMLLQLMQVVKDRVSLRSLEKTLRRLISPSEQAELLSVTALQPLDVNTDETTDDTYKYAKRARRGSRKTRGSRKPSRRPESSDESDGENVPASASRATPRASRRAKTAALEKTKMDLNPLIDQEANCP